MSKRTFPVPPETTPAYPASDNAVLFGDTELYSRLGALVEKSRAGGESGELIEVEKFEIPIRSGKAWVVKKGQLFLLRVMS